MTIVEDRSPARFLRAPVFLTGVLVALQLIVLREVTEGRFAALSLARNAEALLWGHTLTKWAAVALILLLGAGAMRGKLDALLVSGAWYRWPIGAVQIASFAALLWLYPRLPLRHEAPDRLAPPESAAFFAVIAILALFLAASYALILPRNVHRAWRSPLVLWCLAAAPVLVSSWDNTELLNSAILRHLMEGATLHLSLFFYGFSQMPAPTLLIDGPDPLLVAPEFAVRIGIGCSGYQGMLSALVILCAYTAMERRHLRIGRALAVIAVAVLGTFVLNALRIALLFHIGVTGAPEVAENGFHSNFGALAVLSASGLAFLALETAPFHKGAARIRPHPLPLDETERLARMMLPLAGMLVVALLIGLSVATVNWLYPVSAGAGAALLWIARTELRAALRPGPTVWGFAVGLLVFVLWVALVPPDAERSAAFSEALHAAPPALVAAWIAVRVVGASLVVPLVEELAFRGGLLRLIQRLVPAEWGPAAAGALSLAGSSVAFGLLHADIAAGLLAGLAYGALALWRGGLSDAILAHAVTNFLLALTVLVLGHWSYW